MRPALVLALMLAACAGAATDTLFSGGLQPGVSSGKADLDADGREDCWSGETSSGSGAGSTSLTIEAPCGNVAFTIETEHSFGNFLAVTPLPEKISEAMTLAVAELLYGRPPRPLDAIDDSFRVLLGSAPRWTTGPPRVPSSQVIVRLEPRALVAYYAHNHGPLRAVTSCDGLDVLATNHGVVLYDRTRDASRWVYVANDVEKLRWPSIERVTCGTDDVLAIEVRGGETIEVPVRRSSYP